MKKEIEKIGKALGVKLSTQVTKEPLPEEFLAFRKMVFETENVSPATLKEARSLAKRYPGLIEVHDQLIGMLFLSDKRKEANKLLLQAIEKFPGRLELVSLFIASRESPEKTLDAAHLLGSPPDLRNFQPQADGTYHIAQYFSFEIAALRVDIASFNASSMWERVERLLSLDLPESAVTENFGYYFSKFADEEVDRGRVLPAQWKSPSVPSSLPLTKALIKKEWEAYKDGLGNSLQGLLGLDGVDGLDDLLSIFSDAERRVAPQASRSKSPSRKGKSRSPKKAPEIYQLKITLQGIRPPIWRRVLVPAGVELGELHEIIQHVFGWWGYHLHAFERWGESYQPPSRADFDGLEDYATDYTGLCLDQFLQVPQDRLTYEYDFGDGWRHLIVLEKILPVDPQQSYPHCVKGKRNCPPEDVGGAWGYASFLEIIKDPKHPEHAETLEWAGGAFDPEAFDLKEINAGW